MKISLNPIDFLILFLALQGIILSGILFYSSRKIRSNRWIAAFIFVIAETSLAMEARGFLMEHTRLIPLVPFLRLALGPVIFFYTRSLVYGEKKLTGKDYLNFLPILLDWQPQIIFLFYASGILAIPFIQHFYFLPSIQGFLFNQNVLNNLPSFFFMTIYSWISYRMVLKGLAVPHLSQYKLTDLKWLKNLLQLIFVIIALWMITILLTYVSGWNNYILYVPTTIFIYWLGMATIIRQSKMTDNDVVEFNKPPVKIYFSDSEAQKYQRQLILLMKADMLYLNPVLKLDYLAEKLSLTERSISNLLNQHLGKNFNDFVNEYRVAEAKRKLADPMLRQYTISAIAFDCGFNSLATFQRCFKQFTGTTPSEYQRNLKIAPILT